jgi:hypothetical protein
LLVLALAGCNGNAGYVFGFSSMNGAAAMPPPPPSASISVSSAGTSTGLLGALFMIGMMGVASGAFYYPPEMHPDRRVIEQDCTKPIEDYSANLRCR